MKRLLTLFLMLTCVLAHASYDMMLLPGADGRVHRYDPANRIGLGSYQSDFNSLAGVTIDQPSRQAITYGSRMRFSNFDTGEHLNSYGQPASYRYVHYDAAQNLNVALTNTGIVRKLIPTSGGVLDTAVLNSSSVTWSSAMVYRDTMTFVGYNFVGLIHYCSINMSTFVVSPVTATTTTVGNVANPGNGVVGFSIAQNSLLGGFVARRGSGPAAWSFFGMTFNSSGQPTGMAGSLDLPSFDQFDLPKLALGHQSMYAVGQDSTVTSTTRFVQFDHTFNPALMGSWTHNFGTSFQSSAQIANVVAPEPGTWLAMALGGTLLARRRAKRAG